MDSLEGFVRFAQLNPRGFGLAPSNPGHPADSLMSAAGGSPFLKSGPTSTRTREACRHVDSPFFRSFLPLKAAAWNVGCWKSLKRLLLPDIDRW